MASAEVRARLADDVGKWLTDGLIDAPLHEKLRERYGAEPAGVAQLVRMLGISGGALAAFGLLGFITFITESKGFGAAMLELVGAGLLWAGLKLSRDPLGRYGLSSKAVLTLGVMTVCGGLALILALLEIHELSFALGLIAVPLVLALAYTTRTGMLLLIGVLGLFHWVGSWTSMEGRSTYTTDIENPKLMAVAAAIAIGIGVFHELRLQGKTGRFYLTWEAAGLVYVNLSLLILSIDPEHFAGLQRESLVAIWIAVFAAAGFGELLLGARLHSGLFTGFGVTALVLNFYTRFYERLWDKLPKGAFFLLGGAVLLTAGLAFERVQRARNAKAAP